MDNIIKQKIIQSLRETRLKRHSQRCKVFQLKIDYSRLNKKEKEQLKMFFVEAKWIYNDLIRTGKTFNFYKNTKVKVMSKDHVLEEREIKFLPTRLASTVITIFQQNIKSLTAH